MGRPGSSLTPPGEICLACPSGQIEVIVWKHAICWDTPKEGEKAPDPRFENVKVRLNEVQRSTGQPGGNQETEYAWLAEETTDKQGKATFKNVLASQYALTSYTVTARQPGYEDVTYEVPPITVAGSQVNVRHTVIVEVGETAQCDLVLRARQARLNEDGTWDPGRECLRRHGPPKPPEFSDAHDLDDIFWKDEPTLLKARDALWAIVLPLLIVAAALGAALGMLGPLEMLSVVAICAAYMAYLAGIIFGEGVGTPAIAAAAALFGVLLAVNTVLVLFGKEPDAVGTGILGGVWTAFAVGYVGGRREEWRADKTILKIPVPIVVSALAGAAGAAAVTLLLLAGGTPTLGAVLGAALGGFFLGAFSGWAGWAFVNEGKTQAGFGGSDYTLPYLGERYCLQGARGFWTHYENEEGAYDWSMPAYTSVLSAKEGHIVGYYDAAPDCCTGDAARGQANFVAVRHKDGAISRYAYFNREGITTQHWLRRLANALAPSASGWLFPPADVKPSSGINPIHVRSGHVLGPTACLPLHGVATAAGPCPEVFWGWGVGVAVLTLGLVFGAAFGPWNGEPPKEMYTTAQGNWFTKLFTTSDSNYSYGWPGVRDAETAELNNDAALAAKTAGEEPDTKKLAACTDHPYKFDRKFCECLTFGPVKQWANTLSDLLFVVLGLFFILWPFSQSGPDGMPYPNRMTTETGYTLMYGIVCIFMGPGSMLLHISMTASGGLGDGMSMYMFGGYLLAYNIVRLANIKSIGWFYLMFFAAVFLSLAANIWLMQDIATADKTTLIMLFLVGPAVVLLLIASFVYEHDGKGWWWFGGSMLSFILAFTVWGLSYTGRPLCHEGWPVFSPTSHWLQGHALWHMLSAMGVFCLYKFMQREEGNASCLAMPRLHFTVSEAPPPGPTVDQPEPRLKPGERPAELRFKPVKFVDSSTARHESRPWSMRKYKSDNQSLGLPPLPRDIARFNPVGGQHAPPSPYEGAGDYPESSEIPGEGVPT